MTAYVQLATVKQRLAGTVPNMSAAFDAVLVDIIGQVSREIDREVAKVRNQPVGWSFLAERLYGSQVVNLSPIPTVVTAGTFTLALGALVTGAIAYDAAASAVQSALVAVLGANVTVTGPAGGPWVVTFAGTLSGPQAVLVGTPSLTPAASLITVQQLVDGVAAVPSIRRYTAKAGGVRFLAIDDAVSVAGVSTGGIAGAATLALVEGTDYVTRPYQGSPIIGLERLAGVWPAGPAAIAVSLTPGFASSVLSDVEGAAAVETVRSYLAARSGDNDQIGMTPFGAVVTSKAFTSKTWNLINGYRLPRGIG